jgi:hypothetical protein
MLEALAHTVSEFIERIAHGGKGNEKRLAHTLAKKVFDWRFGMFQIALAKVL